MKLDGATIPIEPRGFGEDFDLAGRLYLTDFRQIAPLTAVFLLPALVFAWFACEYTSDGMLLSLAFFYIASPILGAVIIAGEGPRAFGEPFTADRAWSGFAAAAGKALRALLPLRLLCLALAFICWLWMPPLLLFCFAAMLLLAHVSSHVRELVFLERLSGPRLRHRLADLRRHPHGPGKAMRYLQTALVCAFIVFLVFVLVAAVADLLLGFPLLRVGDVEGAEFLPLAMERLRGDPRAVLGVQTILWVVYPLGRLTLFLDYLDVRIRKECWDVEIEFRIEAARLEGLR